eukprot:7938570-Lingulodinium_polyedra.AAC.1
MQIYARRAHDLCTGCALATHGLRARYAWAYARAMHGLCMGDARVTHGLRVAHAWVARELRMACAW